MGIRFLSDDPASRSTALDADDVVILPAFGVTVDDAAAARSARLHAGRHDVRLGAERLEERPALRRGRLHRRSSTARSGTRRRRPRRRRRSSYGGRYLVVLDDGEAAGRLRLHPARRRPRRVPRRASASAVSPGFDPDRDLQRIGLANQTTMLMSRVARDRRDVQGGDASTATARPTLAAHFQAFDTICSATQDRQDAVVALLARARRST